MVKLMKGTILVLALAVLAGCGSQETPQAPAAGTAGGAGFEASTRTLDMMTVAVISRQGNLSGVQAAVSDLVTWASRNGVTPVGVPFGIFMSAPDTPPDSHRYQVCVPVPEGTKPDTTGGVAVRQFGGMQIASALHTGSYDDIGRTYLQLEQWMDEQDLAVAGPVLEFYLTNPQTTPTDSLKTAVAFTVQPRTQ